MEQQIKEAQEKARNEYIQMYCNDHNGHVRWLRNIYYDERDGAEKNIEFLETTIATLLTEARKKWEAELENL